MLTDGALTPLSCTRDGSYIVFQLENGASIVYLAEDSSHSAWLIGGIAGGTAVAAILIFVIVRKKKKKSLTTS